MGSNVNRWLDLRLKEARSRAWQQCGLLSARDLQAHGLTNAKARQRLVERGLLIPVRREVWRLPDARVTEQTDWMAALLWAGDGVLCSHTALRAHGIEAENSSLIHVCTARGPAREDGVLPIKVHHSRKLARAAVVRLGGLKVTSIERTLLDLAGELSEEALQWALEQAWRKGRLVPARFLRTLNAARRRGKDGIRVLKRLLSGALKRQRPMESRLEVRTWRAIVKHGLPPPQVQVTLCDGPIRYRPDFLYPGERLILEALGFEQHGTREAFEKDLLRVAHLTAMGYTVLPISWRMLEEGEVGLMGWIDRALKARRIQKSGLLRIA